MPKVTTFTVVPKLPEKIARLADIAHNLRWCWDPEAIELLFRIDPDLWIAHTQNPVLLLGKVKQDRLQQLAEDESYLAHLERVAARLDEYLASGDWRERRPDTPDGFSVAYFSAEFGLHESLATYSGGLGVLAGDFVKAASDLALPLVGVGLLYREGYLQQYLNADGWQQEQYPQNDFYNLPLTLVRDEAGNQVTVEVEFAERRVKTRIWRCDVGRIALYLLDCDFDANDPDDREITARLYGGNLDMRIRQEILLGIGGVRALRALGIEPAVYHMNEGHAAFLTLERIRELVVKESVPVPAAIESVKAAAVFTTHTPVAAGNDTFPPDMIEHYFAGFAEDVDMPMEQLLGLGRQDPEDPHEAFCMTVLALRLSAGANGVSELHGKTARRMWMRAWPGVPEEEIPITAITNGVHTRFWISRDLAGLYDRYIGPGWVLSPSDPEVWARIDDVPDAELWRTHERRRERLVNFARRRLVACLERRGAPRAEIHAAHEALDPEMLTIGFARRFATYKRANLFLMDPERFIRILTDAKAPVQMIIAGKAHPADTQGKDLIRNIVHFVREYNVRHNVIFIEDYDINVARYMVQGVDCWLNTPRRPMEASGTSGMKAAANGVLNISTPDGWWCEAMGLGENGWSIGGGELYDNADEQDIVESEALYELLEREIVPMFYERGRDGLPRRWVEWMKTAIKSICPVFNTQRMVQDYAGEFYLPCTTRSRGLAADGNAGAVALADWKQAIRRNWDKVRFVGVTCGPTQGLVCGTSLDVTAQVFLDGLSNEDVTVEVYYGELDRHGEIATGKPATMEYVRAVKANVYEFQGAIPCNQTGQLGFAVRVIPSHRDLAQKHETHCITWA
ncbi:MAG: alpha-glucan family phosphorylase [Candidatus Hydrogenedentes bacterium]|nr:alpha-glucan family phosphorylase [Candidatus Hydrogenedentota bacterium]